MFVSKCDMCTAEYKEGESPDWIQISGGQGVLISNAHKSVVKYSVLDFCCPACAERFFAELINTMKPVEQVNQE